MIRFSRKTTQAFHNLLTEALEESLGYGNDQDAIEYAYEGMFEISKEIFNNVEIYELLGKLKRAHEDCSAMWKVNDYHFLILYESLNWYTTGDLDEYPFIFDGKKIKKIDFGSIVDEFFWDTDFLISPEIFNNVSKEQKEMMGMAQETFGVANRLKPHKEELEIKKYKDGNYNPQKGGARLIGC